MIAPRIDEVLRSITWPEPAGCPAGLGIGDSLITCAGFEDRALAFLLQIVRAGASRFRVTGINYLPRIPENRLEELEDAVSRAGATLALLEYRRAEPVSAGEILETIRSAERVFVDVSGMSRLLIVQLVAGLVRNGLLRRASIVYSEAEHYPPSEDEVRRSLAEATDLRGVLSFISSGVSDLTIVPELSTAAMQGQPIRVITFPSFNAAQFATICAEINASAFTVINGVPPSPENRWRRKAIRELNGIESVHDREEVDVSTLDYRQTLQAILDVYGRYGATQKLIIAPTGSKMQSVGAGLACGFLRDIQVVYPTPLTFPSPSRYTTGIRATTCLSLAPFAVVTENRLQTPVDE